MRTGFGIIGCEGFWVKAWEGTTANGTTAREETTRHGTTANGTARNDSKRHGTGRNGMEPSTVRHRKCIYMFAIRLSFCQPHQQSNHGDQLFWCVDHGHEGPSSDEGHGVHCGKDQEIESVLGLGPIGY